ncbi:glutamate/gamma-aminobutyrate family transporter YjeM [Apilactobacillus micheneri]|uniref:glutamate/gamma-aminobutyrate family transporter YjeM n=1 Tax=Apilactobacillus micheneri TaxID=1899430 RepID=UPI002989ABD0|nr:glutamate/gamma-aminobutyrate family transporter YjeM [Apilactobacillus micheneri]
MENMQSQKKISTMGLVLIIFSTIFGISNSQTAFYQMGYSSIIWYILGAILFFIPTSLMFAEYGSTFKDAHGGIYSWLEQTIGKRWAFIGSFTWLAGWVITLVSLVTNMWIPLAVTISGKDTTGSWHLFGLDSTATIGVLGILVIMFVTWLASRGMKSIAGLSYVSGIIGIVDLVIFVGLSILVLMANHGQFAEPINMHTLAVSPNPAFQSPVSMFSFLVYAIFAYAGMETLGSITDNTKNPKKTFPRAVIIATVVMTVGYLLGILMCGISANWLRDLGHSDINLGNVRFALLTNLGVEFGHNLLHLNTGQSLLMGQWVARFTSLTGFISYLGEFIFLTYAPIKSFIEGSPKKLWPKTMTKLNKFDVPAHALWVQCLVICLIIAGVSFGGSSAQAFYTILTDMNNMTTAVPYLFLVIAFPLFKKKITQNKDGFIFYQNKTFTNVTTVITIFTLAFAIIFTTIQPLMDHDIQTAFWTLFGPVFFIIVAWLFYSHGVKKLNQE